MALSTLACISIIYMHPRNVYAPYVCWCMRTQVNKFCTRTVTKHLHCMWISSNYLVLSFYNTINNNSSIFYLYLMNLSVSYFFCKKIMPGQDNSYRHVCVWYVAHLSPLNLRLLAKCKMLQFSENSNLSTGMLGTNIIVHLENSPVCTCPLFLQFDLCLNNIITTS